MKKLFISIIVILSMLNVVGCTQGLFIGSTIVSQSEDIDMINEDLEPIPNEEQESIIKENEEELKEKQSTEDSNNEENQDDTEGKIDEKEDEEIDEVISEEIDEEVNEIIEDEHTDKDEAVIRYFNTSPSSKINLDIRYDKYPIGFDYVLTLNAVKVRKGPGLDQKVIDILQPNEKISLISEVKGEYIERWDSDLWYQIEWIEGEEVKTGFIYAPLAEARRFQFEKMEEALYYLKGESNTGELAYISNYKNINGAPPLLNGSAWDEFGYRRSQSAAGYDSPQKGKSFRYIPDGMLVSVLEEKENFTKVNVIGWEGEYWVESKYINKKNTLKELRKVIIVDRTFQNQSTFEYNEGQWSLISYSLATTGRKGMYSLETPLGYYMAIQKRDKFLYFKDGTKEIAGYAPYAIRFSGGGYIHGVPVEYIIEEDNRIDPGMTEYLHTIGTVPRSHMCVRNYTSHAEFLYNWVEIGNSAVIVIE